MPYEWLPPTTDAPDMSCLRLRPHRSLPRTGFVWFIGATAVLLAIPLVGLIGSPVLWGILPFLLGALWAIWWALQRSYRDGEITETLLIGRDHVKLTRDGPRNRRQTWEANPHWVRVALHPKGGPVPNYLTLSGAGREVELGAFLSEDERVELEPELVRALARVR